jgi:hypothetical protein
VRHVTIAFVDYGNCGIRYAVAFDGHQAASFYTRSKEEPASTALLSKGMLSQVYRKV